MPPEKNAGTILEIRLGLREAGFSPLPINGKRPVQGRWQTRLGQQRRRNPVLGSQFSTCEEHRDFDAQQYRRLISTLSMKKQPRRLSRWCESGSEITGR